MSKVIKLETSSFHGEKPKLKIIQGGNKKALKEALDGPEIPKGEQIFKAFIICANQEHMTAKQIKHQCNNVYGKGIFEEYQDHANTLSDLYQTLLAA